MANEDYASGYNDGFEAGYKAGVATNTHKVTTPTWTPVPYEPPKGHTCRVCGMLFEAGKAYGCVCGHDRCPSRVTYTLTANTQWSSWMSGRPF